MPDLDPLPGRPRVPDFTPRTGDYAAVVDRAKGRRRRHLTTASAGAAGVAVVVALTAGGGGGTFGLKPVPPAAPGGSAVPTATPEESPSPEGSEPGAPRESAAPGEGGAVEPSEGAAERTPEPSPHPEPSHPGSGGDDDDGGDPPPPPRAQRPVVVRDTVAFRTTDTCQTNASFVAATGWCLGYEGPAVVQIGVPAPFRLLACRPTGRGGKTFRFETEQQVEFVVSSGERAEWRWSGGYPFPKNENTVHVAESTCARWSIEWDGTGDDGDPLRPGTYTMATEVLAPYSEQFGTSTSNGDTVEVVD